MASSGYSSEEERTPLSLVPRSEADHWDIVENAGVRDWAEMPFNHIAMKNYLSTQRHYALSEGPEDHEYIHIGSINSSEADMFDTPASPITHSTRLYVDPDNPKQPAKDARRFYERVAIGDAGELPTIETSVKSVFEKKCDQRSKFELALMPRLTPNRYQDRIVCHVNCTKKHFRSTTHYIPRLHPRGFTETCYVLPERSGISYVSSLNYGSAAKGAPRWYTTCVEIQPRSFPNDAVCQPPRSDISDSEDDSIISDSDDERSSVSNTEYVANCKVDINQNLPIVINITADEDSHLAINGFTSSDEDC